MKLGARILKTGIAVTLAIYVAKLVGIPSPAFAGIAALFAIQPSIYRTYQSIIEQVQGNVIGAIMAILFSIMFGHDPFVIGLTVIIVISIILRLKLESTISLAIVTVVAIMESPSETFIQFALYRFSAIMIGVFASFIVNLLFIPPKYEPKLYHKIVDITEEIFKYIRVSLTNASEYSILKDDIDRLKERTVKMENLYLFYKEERQYFRKKHFVKARKLVLFRQMMISTSISLNLLRKLHKLENDYHQLPVSLQQMIKENIDSLTTYHEQLLFKYIGKIRSNPTNSLIADLSNQKDQTIKAFMELYSQQNDYEQQIWLHVLPLLTIITEYHDTLEHLDQLIDSFQNYHKEDNEVNITEKEEE
ncbi:FUSC family protein [Bacillus sp. Marseille-P3661]|uniref:FUSC family protein n=1 Tax=Bacillus sp. Marseille-P3661 TaxID=1936234 RepID=UPI000C81538B|nr:aromatic acid exporter family protein [Bacillus sp. Marseille-P3661]